MVTSRAMRIAQIALSAAFAGLGIGALAKGDYLNGAIWLAFGVAWLLIAAFRDRLRAARERQRARLRP